MSILIRHTLPSFSFNNIIRYRKYPDVTPVTWLFLMQVFFFPCLNLSAVILDYLIYEIYSSFYKFGCVLYVDQLKYSIVVFDTYYNHYFIQTLIRVRVY